MKRRIAYAPEADAQLHALRDYIAGASSPEIAERYVNRILERCESLSDFPNRGTPHDDLRLGLRSIPFQRRVTIVYAVETSEVTIIGVLYAGQDLEGLMGQN